jgi:hypothetical protein
MLLIGAPMRSCLTLVMRNFINLVAAVVLLTIAIGVVWVVKAMEANEALNRCVATGRRDCVRLDVPPRPIIVTPEN